MNTSIKAQAVKIVDAAGQAGGNDEVRRLAEHGWPANRGLENDSPELREAIRLVAQHATTAEAI